MSRQVLASITSCRIVTSGDMDFNIKKFPTRVFKQLIGQDMLAITPLLCTMTASMIGGCNSLPNPGKPRHRDWCTPDIMRRVVVLYMDVDACLLPQCALHLSDADRADFLCRCIHVRLSRPQVPISPRSLMYTLCGALAPNAMRAIRPCQPADATVTTSLRALLEMCKILQVSPASLCHMVSMINRDYVTSDSPQRISCFTV